MFGDTNVSRKKSKNFVQGFPVKTAKPDEASTAIMTVITIIINAVKKSTLEGVPLIFTAPSTQQNCSSPVRIIIFEAWGKNRIGGEWFPKNIILW